MNKHSYVSISNTTSDQPILIVDRDGQLGVPLAQKISREFLTVLVTARQLPQMQNIIHVPYKYKVPIIPDNTFSKIFLHYQDPKELLVMLPSYIRKAQSTRTPLFCLLHISQATQTLISEICNSYGYASVFVYGELFGERITEHNIFNNFLHQAKTRGSMSIPNNGLDKIYPVAFTDVINGIVQVVFSGSLASRTYLLFPKTPITSLAAARMIPLKPNSPKLPLLSGI